MAAPPRESKNPRTLRMLVRIRVWSVLDDALDEEPVGYERRPRQHRLDPRRPHIRLRPP